MLRSIRNVLRLLKSEVLGVFPARPYTVFSGKGFQSSEKQRELGGVPEGNDKLERNREMDQEEGVEQT